MLNDQRLYFCIAFAVAALLRAVFAAIVHLRDVHRRARALDGDTRQTLESLPIRDGAKH